MGAMAEEPNVDIEQAPNRPPDMAAPPTPASIRIIARREIPRRLLLADRMLGGLADLIGQPSLSYSPLYLFRFTAWTTYSQWRGLRFPGWLGLYPV